MTAGFDFDLIFASKLRLRYKPVFILVPSLRGRALRSQPTCQAVCAAEYTPMCLPPFVYLNYTYYINILEDAYGC